MEQFGPDSCVQMGNQLPSQMRITKYTFGHPIDVIFFNREAGSYMISKVLAETSEENFALSEVTRNKDLHQSLVQAGSVKQNIYFNLILHHWLWPCFF